MDTFSSYEDLAFKARKPYTITKQRERWSEEEHNRFLEALKLYGRAWQRIEDLLLLLFFVLRLGASRTYRNKDCCADQKSCTKVLFKGQSLEKDALVKGVPVGQALDIDIPPPRPKRKPSNPYPRKTGVGSPKSQVGAKDGKLLTSVSSLQCKQVFDLEKEPLPEKSAVDDKVLNAREHHEDNCSEVLSLLQEANSSSVSVPNRSSVPTPVTLKNPCKFREHVLSFKEVINQNETNGSFDTNDIKSKQKLDKSVETQKVHCNGASKISNLENDDENLVEGNKLDNSNSALSTGEMQATQSYPRHVPVHVLDGSQGTCSQTSDLSQGDTIFHPMGNVHPNPFMNPAASGTVEHQNNSPKSYMHPSFPSFHRPIVPFCHNQEDYQSLFHVSSAFSSLIVSTLLQNPAAHAAANFAATYWPHGATRPSPGSTQGGSQSRHVNSSPDMAAIAGATVAAATAWWAAHGLLPMCAPLNPAFTCTPASTTAVQSMNIDQVQEAKTERKEDTIQNQDSQDLHLDPECSEALQAQLADPKSPTASSSASEESGGAKVSAGSQVPEDEAAVNEVQDSDKSKTGKPVDRSSCGSNTASSSDVETDALQKQDKGNEEPKDDDANHVGVDSNNRRGRSICNLNESWKEVSEEGRMAFKALFNRQRLPQSFSPTHDLENKEHQNNNGGENHNPQEKNEEETGKDEKNSDALLLDLNRKTGGSLSDHQEGERTLSSMGDEDGLLTLGLGHSKFRTRRTGFKPYKRCSVEARDATSQDEEKGPKRIRLDEEASL